MYFEYYLFCSLKSPVNWTNPAVVGDSNYPTYNGRDVVVSTLTLTEFMNYMNSLSLPFTYDHAVGWLKYVSDM